MGYPSALTAKTWGFQDVLFKGKPLVPAAGVRQLRDGERAVQDFVSGGVSRADGGRSGDDPALRRSRDAARRDRARGRSRRKNPGVRIIDKTGPLANPADRDHCIQYMVAIPAAVRPTEGRRLRGRRRRPIRASMRCAPRCRSRKTRRSHRTTTTRTSATSATRCRCSSRTARPSQRVAVDYPIGHRKRRDEGMPQLVKKFEASVAAHFGPSRPNRSRRCSRTATL